VARLDVEALDHLTMLLLRIETPFPATNAMGNRVTGKVNTIKKYNLVELQYKQISREKIITYVWFLRWE